MLITTIEVNNTMKGTKFELHALPTRDLVESSSLETPNKVISLLSAREVRLPRVYVMSLERFYMLEEEATLVKKTQLEIISRLLGVEGGSREI